MPYQEAAALTNEAGLDEPEEDTHADLPDEYRMVAVLSEGGTLIERAVETGEAWAELARFTHPDASMDWADELADALADDGDYRVVYDWDAGDVGAWLLEVRVDVEDDA